MIQLASLLSCYSLCYLCSIWFFTWPQSPGNLKPLCMLNFLLEIPTNTGNSHVFFRSLWAISQDRMSSAVVTSVPPNFHDSNNRSISCSCQVGHRSPLSLWDPNWWKFPLHLHCSQQEQMRQGACELIMVTPILLTSHWPKQVVQPHQTSEGAGSAFLPEGIRIRIPVNEPNDSHTQILFPQESLPSPTWPLPKHGHALL